MGLFESITGQVLSSLSNTDSSQHAGLVSEIAALINSQPGGISGLISAFEQQGLGGVVQSWVGNGQNLPVSAEQIQAVLGNEQIQAIAGKLGFSPEEVSSHLSQLLPQVVDKMTPEGTVPEGGAVSELLGALKGFGR